MDLVLLLYSTLRSSIFYVDYFLQNCFKGCLPWIRLLANIRSPIPTNLINYNFVRNATTASVIPSLVYKRDVFNKSFSVNLFYEAFFFCFLCLWLALGYDYAPSTQAGFELLGGFGEDTFHTHSRGIFQYLFSGECQKDYGLEIGICRHQIEKRYKHLEKQIAEFSSSELDKSCLKDIGIARLTTCILCPPLLLNIWDFLVGLIGNFFPFVEKSKTISYSIIEYFLNLTLLVFCYDFAKSHNLDFIKDQLYKFYINCFEDPILLPIWILKTLSLGCLDLLDSSPSLLFLSLVITFSTSYYGLYSLAATKVYGVYNTWMYRNIPRNPEIPYYVLINKESPLKTEELVYANLGSTFFVKLTYLIMSFVFITGSLMKNIKDNKDDLSDFFGILIVNMILVFISFVIINNIINSTRELLKDKQSRTNLYNNDYFLDFFLYHLCFLKKNYNSSNQELVKTSAKSTYAVLPFYFMSKAFISAFGCYSILLIPYFLVLPFCFHEDAILTLIIPFLILAINTDNSESPLKTLKDFLVDNTCSILGSLISTSKDTDSEGISSSNRDFYNTLLLIILFIVVMRIILRKFFNLLRLSFWYNGSSVSIRTLLIRFLYKKGGEPFLKQFANIRSFQNQLYKTNYEVSKTREYYTLLETPTIDTPLRILKLYFRSPKVVYLNQEDNEIGSILYNNVEPLKLDQKSPTRGVFFYLLKELYITNFLVSLAGVLGYFFNFTLPIILLGVVDYFIEGAYPSTLDL